MRTKWIALICLALCLLFGVQTAYAAENSATATIDLVFDGMTFTDTVQVEWNERYVVPEGGVVWDGTEEFVAFEPYTLNDVVYDEEEIPYVDGQITFTTQLGDYFYEIENIAAKFGAKVVGYIALTNSFVIEVDEDKSIENLHRIVNELKKEPLIYPDSVMLNYGSWKTLTSEYPTDPWTRNDAIPPADWTKGKQEISDNTDKHWGVVAINAPQAWKYRDYMQKQKIGIIDGTFPDMHDDISFASVVDIDDEGKTHKGDFKSNGTEDFDKSHGVHVAGTVAAIYNNGKGISGVFPNGEIVAVGVSRWNKDAGAFWITKEQDYFVSYFTLIGAITECLKRDASIINISMANSSEINKAVVEKAYDSYFNNLEIGNIDFLIVCAAGNSPQDAELIQEFLSIDNEYLKQRLMVVSSVEWDETDHVPVFYGGHAYGPKVDILAPGVRILSCIMDKENTNSGDIEKYGEKDGTSMAAPHVTGVAAMIKSIDPDITGPEIKSILLRHGERIRDSHGYIHPILDAYACVRDVLGLGSVVGKVTDGQIGQEGIQIEVSQNGQHIVTLIADMFGKFDSGDLASGEYVFTINAEGYKKIEEKAVVIAGQYTLLEDFQLEKENVSYKKNTLSCVVIDIDTQLPLNATITLIPQNTSDESAIIQIPGIGNTGILEMELDAGNYELQVSMDGYLSHSEGIIITKGNTTSIKVELVSENSEPEIETGTLVCTVVDEYTQLPLNAAVEIIPLNAGGNDTAIQVTSISLTI